MKNTVKKMSLLMVMVGFSLVATNCTRIDPGSEGVRVNNYGDAKGTDSVALGVGNVWYNPFTESIYEYSVINQQYEFTAELTKASPTDEAVRFQTDGLELVANLGIQANVIPGKSPVVFATFRKEFYDIMKTFVLQDMKDSFIQHSSGTTVDQIIGSGKIELIKAVQDDLQKKYLPLGIAITKVSYLNAIDLPPSVKESINAKIAATQKSQQRENEIAQTKAEAQKKIEQARGDAESIEIQGKALRNNPEVLKLRALEIQEKFVEKGTALPQTLVIGKDSGELIFNLNNK